MNPLAKYNRVKSARVLSETRGLTGAKRRRVRTLSKNDKERNLATLLLAGA